MTPTDEKVNEMNRENEVNNLRARQAELDARTIYDIACIREARPGATREDVDFKAIALRNWEAIAALSALPAGGGAVAVKRDGRGLIQSVVVNGKTVATNPEYVVATTPQPDAAACLACENKPAPGNSPCAVCGAQGEGLRDEPAFHGRVGRLAVEFPSSDGEQRIEYLLLDGKMHKLDDIRRYIDIALGRAAPAAGKGVDDASERQPDGYAYRYEDGFIRHNGGRDHNGMRPTETIPFYYGSAPALTRQPEGKGVDDVAAAVERLKDRTFPQHECPAESAAVWNVALYELEAALTRQAVAGNGNDGTQSETLDKI